MNSIALNTNTGSTVSLGSDLLSSLNDQLRGECITAGHDQYDSSRRLWNGLVEKAPGVIARCTGVADVIAAVKFADRHNLKISVRGGGHNVAGSCLADDGFVIDLSTMRSIRANPEKQIAWVEGGARLGDLDHETQAFGLAVPVGVVSATGVAGLTLHGGMGWLLRKHGLSIDNLVAAEVVTADGRQIRADRNHNQDLFWALRGGGGNFGVVTAFEFKLHPAGPQVWFCAAIYPMQRAPEIMTAFHQIMESAPDDLMGLGVYWSAPDLPVVPARYHGTPVVILLGCHTGPFDEGERAIAPLRSIGEPIADLSGPMSWVDVQRFLDADYPDGQYYYWKSIYLDRLDDHVLEILSSSAAERPSPISSIDVWTLGGAMNRVKETETAHFQRDAAYMIGIEANWSDAVDNEGNIAWARRLHEELSACTRGGDYLNFPGFFEDRERMLRGAYGPNLEKLKSIKAKYDPKNLFAGAINISPG